MLLDAYVPAVEVDPGEAGRLVASHGHGTGLRLMFAGSVLQALTIHLRQGRGRLFDLDTRDVGSLTVGQLAALLRTHRGSAGQGFELAVADALNAGVPGVVVPVRDALERVGVPMTEPRAVVMGLEKTANPAVLAAVVAEAVAGRRLRTGRVGGQPLAARAVERLIAAGTAIRAERGALSYADLIVYDGAGPAAVTTSVKIAPVGYNVPADPPRLWITTGNPARLRDDLPSFCAVAAVGGPVLAAYQTVHAQVVGALAALDRQRTPPPGVVTEVLRSRWRQPVRAAFEELYSRAEAAPQLTERRLHLVTAEMPDEFAGYGETATESGLVVLRRRPLSDFVGLHSQFFTQPLAA
ncbi:hypothetical protein ACI78V_02105 [Geodermatophilus sp. SYSU D00742]